MKRFALTGLLVLCSAAAAWAFDFQGEWSRRVGAEFQSRYMWHGVERAGESVQPSAWLLNGGLKLGSWMNFPVNDTRSHEFAVVAGYTHEFSDSVALTADVTHFHLRDSRAGHPGHTAELRVALDRKIGPGRASVSYLRDVNRQADLVEVAYGGEWALRSWGAFVNYRVYAGTTDAQNVLPHAAGPKIRDAYLFHGADLTVPYRVGGATIVTAGVHYAGTDGQQRFWSPIGASPGGKIWATLATTFEF